MADRQKYPEAHRRAIQRYIAERRRWLNDYKLRSGCADCGTHEGRLDFDHRPGEVKLFNLGRPRASFAKIEAEVAKCDVRCVACHARRHGLMRSPEQMNNMRAGRPIGDQALGGTKVAA